MSNFGAGFRKARESSGLALEKISAETRISTRFLTAIENEDFHLLPGGVFNRGFIRSYAERIGINPDQALADYERISSNVEEPVEVLRNVERESMRRSERNLYPIAAGLLLLVILVFYVVTRNGSTGPAAGPLAQPVAAVVVPEPTPTSAPPTVPVAETTGPAAPIPTSALVLDLNVKDLTWIRIITDGSLALSQNLAAGAMHHFTAASSIDVTIGNAGGAGMTINGRKVLALGKSGEVRQFTITPENAGQVP